MKLQLQSQLQRAQSWPSAPAVPRSAAPCRLPRATQQHQQLRAAHAAPASWRAPQPQCRPCPRHSTSGSYSRRSVQVRASWGAPVDFSKAKVVSNRQEGPGLHQLLVDIGPSLAAQYQRPGQYIQAKTQDDGKAGFFAIASAPEDSVNNQGVIELLIKAQAGATADDICKLEAGAELLVSAPQGKGFPVERIPPSAFDTVLLVATGTGISPIKAVIESDVLELSKRKQVTLYYGSRTQELTAYKSLFPEWTSKGVKVVQVLSGDTKKYVQALVAEDMAHVQTPSKVGLLLCGQKDMSIAIKELCNEKGVAQEAVLSNF